MILDLVDSLCCKKSRFTDDAPMDDVSLQPMVKEALPTEEEVMIADELMVQKAMEDGKTEAIEDGDRDGQPETHERHRFSVGDVVRVRNKTSSPWRAGTVSKGLPLMVRPDGWTCGYQWRFVDQFPAAEFQKRSLEPERLRKLVKEVSPCDPAQRPAFLPTTGPQQLQIPPAQWALTIQQFTEFMCWCMQTPEYKAVRRIKDHVTEYDLNHLFITPLTKTAGCSIALLLNPTGLSAKIMISHAWGEDATEALDAVKNVCQKHQIPHDTPIWFCPFSIYQAAEVCGIGPTISEQLKLEPFQNVINSEPVRQFSDSYRVGMIVIHTSGERVYGRLWCVHEIDEALLMEPPLEVKGAASSQWVCDPIGGVLAAFKVDSGRATCSFPADQAMLQERINSHTGGFKRLDTVIRQFRLEMFKSHASQVSQDVVKKLKRLPTVHRTARVRDSPTDEWLVGKLTSYEPLRVQPENWTYGYHWKHIEFELETNESEQKVPVSDPHASECAAWPPFLSLVGAKGQKCIPKEKWSITLSQLNQYEEWMSQMPQYKSVKSKFGTINYQNILDIFLEPLARVSTCSLGLFFNKDEPLPCKLFVSLARGEDSDEFREAINLHYLRRKIPATTPMYVFIYSMWQKPDEVAWQCEAEGEEVPFAQVMRSCFSSSGYVLMCTSTGNPFSRLWCMCEFAMCLAEKAEVDVAPSRAFLVDPPGGFAYFMDMHTEAATCSSEKDVELLRKQIETYGGFQKINRHLQLRLFRFLQDVAMEYDSDEHGASDAVLTPIEPRAVEGNELTPETFEATQQLIAQGPVSAEKSSVGMEMSAGGEQCRNQKKCCAVQ